MSLLNTLLFLGSLGTGEMVFILLSLMLSMFVFIIPILIALIDILKSEFEGNDKIVWLLVVIFLNFLGALLYYFIGRKQKLK